MSKRSRVTNSYRTARALVERFSTAAIARNISGSNAVPVAEDVATASVGALTDAVEHLDGFGRVAGAQHPTQLEARVGIGVVACLAKELGRTNRLPASNVRPSLLQASLSPAWHSFVSSSTARFGSLWK